MRIYPPCTTPWVASGWTTPDEHIARVARAGARQISRTTEPTAGCLRADARPGRGYSYCRTPRRLPGGNQACHGGYKHPLSSTPSALPRPVSIAAFDRRDRTVVRFIASWATSVGEVWHGARPAGLELRCRYPSLAAGVLGERHRTWSSRNTQSVLEMADGSPTSSNFRADVPRRAGA